MSHLSDVFKYISHFRHAGHQVGRKVGDMLEVLTFSALNLDPDIKPLLHIEPKIYGYTDAGHKVEFALRSTASPTLRKGGEIQDVSGLLALIECKKVGVEQTINQTFKKRRDKRQGKTFSNESAIEFRFGRSVDQATDIEIRFSASAATCDIHVIKNGAQVLHESARSGHRIIFALTRESGVVILGNDQSLRDLDETLIACKIFEVDNVDATGASIRLNDCLGGPQTPEKAKQASFVALDVRKRRFDQFDKRLPENQMKSILVLTELSHWEPKSRRMVRACLDLVLEVPDSLIIESFEKFHAMQDNFYDLISKDQYELNPAVRTAVDQIVESYHRKIFRPLDETNMRSLVMRDGVLDLD